MTRQWETGVDYYIGEIIMKDEKRWICKETHTAKEFDKTLWGKIDTKESPPKEYNNKVAIITSMDINYYEKVGKAMLKSWKAHWAHLYPMYVYNEAGFRVKVRGTKSLGWQLGNDYLSFMRRHTNDKVKTFAKKAFSIIHAMDTIDCEKLIWLDADVIIKNSLPENLIDILCPKDTLSAHFSVWHVVDDVKYHSCETGFFILNKKHPKFKEFRETYRRIYLEDDTNGIRRFYDGEVYGKTVDALAQSGAKMVNLTSGPHKTPIPRSIMAPYISHFKAGLKERVDFDKVLENTLSTANYIDLDEDDEI